MTLSGWYHGSETPKYVVLSKMLIDYSRGNTELFRIILITVWILVV